MTTAMTHDPASALVKLCTDQRALEKLKHVAARHLNPERFLRLAVGAFRRTPALHGCSPASVLDSVMLAARLGLEPDGGALAHAYLVPHKGECTLIVGYRGLAELARRSGVVKRIEARLVYADDEFAYSLGSDPKIVHKPAMLDESDEALTHAYAVAFYADGSTQFEVMSRAAIEHVRKSSRASRPDAPWNAHYQQMCAKSAVRRLCKMLPLSPELAAGTALHDQGDDDRDTITVKAEARDLLGMNPDTVYLAATVDRPPPPATGQTVEQRKRAARPKAPEAPPAPVSALPSAKDEERERHNIPSDSDRLESLLGFDLAAGILDAIRDGDKPETVLTEGFREWAKKAGMAFVHEGPAKPSTLRDAALGFAPK